MKSYKGKIILIWGLGRYEHGSGISAVKFLLSEHPAKVIVSDLQSESDLQEQVNRVKDYVKEIAYQGILDFNLMGKDLDDSDLLDIDIIVPNPGVPISKVIELVGSKGIEIESEMSLFFDICPAEKIIGITGTRGKSTTSKLIHHILQSSGMNVVLGGNISEASPLDYIDQVNKTDFFVLEISNFMLEYLDIKQQSPHLAVLLNVLPDHLNRYKGEHPMYEYANVKGVITKYQSDSDILITNSGNEYTKIIGDETRAQVKWFDQLEGDFVSGITDTGFFPLKGEHNVYNAKVAITVAQTLGVEDDQIKEAIGSWSPLSYRLEQIRELNGVTFYNDTTSTTPVSTKAALMSFDKDIVLIAGGADKGLEFDQLAQYVKEHPIKAIVWLYKNDELSKGTLSFQKALVGAGANVKSVSTGSMNEALDEAYKLAQGSGVVLLSPGCSSFDLFKNEFDRGDQFNDAVNALS